MRTSPPRSYARNADCKKLWVAPKAQSPASKMTGSSPTSPISTHTSKFLSPHVLIHKEFCGHTLVYVRMLRHFVSDN